MGFIQAGFRVTYDFALGASFLNFIPMYSNVPYSGHIIQRSLQWNPLPILIPVFLSSPITPIFFLLQKQVAIRFIGPKRGWYGPSTLCIRCATGIGGLTLGRSATDGVQRLSTGFQLHRQLDFFRHSGVWRMQVNILSCRSQLTNQHSGRSKASRPFPNWLVKKKWSNSISLSSIYGNLGAKISLTLN